MAGSPLTPEEQDARKRQEEAYFEREDWFIVGGGSQAEEERKSTSRHARLAHTELARAARVAAFHLETLLDGRRWLAPLNVPALFITEELSAHGWEPLTPRDRLKTRTELMVTTRIGVEDLAALPEDQRAWRLITHHAAMPEEVGKAYRLGPPPVRAAVLAELRRADRLDLEAAAVASSHVRALKGETTRGRAR